MNIDDLGYLAEMGRETEKTRDAYEHAQEHDFGSMRTATKAQEYWRGANGQWVAIGKPALDERLASERAAVEEVERLKFLLGHATEFRIEYDDGPSWVSADDPEAMSELNLRWTRRQP